MVPKGADTVIKLEETAEDGGYVKCMADPGRGYGIRPKGDSLKKGQIVLRAGNIISPLEIGALASMRRAYVYVHCKPVVAILSTGDELSDFHEPASPLESDVFEFICVGGSGYRTQRHPPLSRNPRR